MTGVDGDLPEQFVFDPASNIVASSSDGDAAAPGFAVGDRLLMRGDRKFEYDGCGNRVREVRGAGGNVERLYRYRADNQLAEVEESSRLGRRVTSFSYDALGRRTEKRSRTWGPPAANDAISGADPALEIVTAFVWNGDVLLAEGHPEDPFTTVYLHEPESFRPLAQVRRAANGAISMRHYQLDHIGTPVGMTNDNGRTVWRSRARAWGGAVTALADEEESQPIGFQGQYRDVETGLHYNRFRFYAPDEGCYVQQDPLGGIAGTNFSFYVPAPTGWVDPYGFAPCFTGGAKRAEAKGFPGIGTTPNGGPTFADTPYLYPAGPGQSSVVKIPLTGSRAQDFSAANAAGGFEDEPEGYVWHHVDDFDPETGESSVELVQRDAHIATFPHKGSVGQYQDFYGVKYRS